MNAMWEGNVYTIVYNANGGTGTMANTNVTYGTSTPLRTNTFTKSGYTFGGWYAYRDYDGKYYGYAQGSSTAAWLPLNEIVSYYIYSNGQNVSKTTPEGTATFYAKWN
jgi:hypothetical protein